MRKLFGTGLFSHCPLATTSRLYVDVSEGNVELSRPPGATHSAHVGGSLVRYAAYDLRAQAGDGFNLVAKVGRAGAAQARPLVHVNRYIREYGKESGGIVATVYNKHRKPLVVTYFENLPWYVPIYYHTLRVRRLDDGTEVSPATKSYRGKSLHSSRNAVPTL